MVRVPRTLQGYVSGVGQYVLADVEVDADGVLVRCNAVTVDELRFADGRVRPARRVFQLRSMAN